MKGSLEIVRTPAYIFKNVEDSRKNHASEYCIVSEFFRRFDVSKNDSVTNQTRAFFNHTKMNKAPNLHDPVYEKRGMRM